MNPELVGPNEVFGGAAAAAAPAYTAAERLAFEQEGARQWIAACLIALVGAIALLVLVTFAVADDRARLANALGIVFGPIVALLGSVIGFYFGTKKDDPG